MNDWTKRFAVVALLTLPVAAYAAGAVAMDGGGGCVLGMLFGCGS